jgi:hypothetical protein
MTEQACIVVTEAIIRSEAQYESEPDKPPFKEKLRWLKAAQ